MLGSKEREKAFKKLVEKGEKEKEKMQLQQMWKKMGKGIQDVDILCPWSFLKKKKVASQSRKIF